MTDDPDLSRVPQQVVEMCAALRLLFADSDPAIISAAIYAALGHEGANRVRYLIQQTVADRSHARTVRRAEGDGYGA